MRYVLIGLLFLAVVALAASLGGMSMLGVHKEETPEFKSLARDGAFEVRAYGPLVVARTTSDAEFDAGSYSSFQRLAGYIFGGNQRRESIAMTAPVFMEKQADGERLPMTAPVFQERAAAGWTMSFVLPSGRTLDNLPRPLDGTVSLETEPGRVFATIRFAGLSSERRFERKTSELRRWMARRGLEEKGEPRIAGYDPPWTLPAFRRNEVFIETEWPESR